MAGEAIIVPILIDPKAGVAGLKAFGNAAVETGAKLTTANTGSKLFGDGIKGLGKNLLAINPLWGIGIAAVSSFVTSLIGASDTVDDFAEKQKKIAGFQKQVAEDLGKEVAQISKLKAAIESEVTSRKQKELALAQLKKINPEYFGDLTTEEGLINKLNVAYGNYLKNIVARAEVNVLGKQLEELSATIIELERKGATAEFFTPELKRDREGQLQISKRLTDEQLRQNQLNLPYSAALRERKALLDQILLKQVGLNEVVVTPDVKVTPKKTKPDKWFDFSKVPVEIIPPEEAQNQGLTFAQMFGREVEAYFKQTDPIDFSLINAPQAYDDAKKKAAELLAMNVRLSEQISGSLTPATDAFIDALLTRGDALQAFFQGIRSAIGQLIKQIVAAIAQAAILSLLTGGASGGGLSLRGALKKITGFAAGGLVTGPVSALVGEGAGTNRSNPEVIAPLDKLKSFFAQMNGRGAGFNGGNMGIAGSLLAVPGNIQLRASGRDLMGVLDLETLNRRRTG